MKPPLRRPPFPVKEVGIFTIIGESPRPACYRRRPVFLRRAGEPYGRRSLFAVHSIVVKSSHSQGVNRPRFFVDKPRGNIYMYRQLISFPVGFSGFDNVSDSRVPAEGLPDRWSSIDLCRDRIALSDHTERYFAEGNGAS